MIETTSKSTPLPFWKTVWDAHRLTLGNAMPLARISWPWIALMSVVTAVLNW